MNRDLYDVLRSRWKGRAQDKWVFFNEDTGTRFMHRPKMMKGLCKRAGIPPIGMGKRKMKPRELKAFIKKHKREPEPAERFVESPIFYGFHSLRHFMASFLADQEKVGTKAVSGLLRHKNLRTTEIYLHSIDESHRQAMDGFEGKFAPKNANPQPAAATKAATTITVSPASLFVPGSRCIERFRASPGGVPGGWILRSRCIPCGLGWECSVVSSAGSAAPWSGSAPGTSWRNPELDRWRLPCAISPLRSIFCHRTTRRRLFHMSIGPRRSCPSYSDPVCIRSEP